MLELLVARGGALLGKFALTLYLAHAAGLDVLGWYGLIVGSSLALPVLVRGGILNALLREIAVANGDAIRSELGRYLSFIAMAYGALALIALVISLAGVVELPIALTILWIIYCEQCAADTTQILFGLHKPRVAAWLTFAHSLAWTIAYMLISSTDTTWRTMDGLLIVWAAGGAVTIAALWHSIRGQLRCSPSAEVLMWGLRWISASRAIFLHEILNIVRDFGDRFLISALMSIEAAGVYVFFLQFASAASTLVNSAIVFARRSALVSAAQKGAATFSSAYKALYTRALGLMAILLILCVVGFLGLDRVILPEAISAHFVEGCWILAAGWLQMALTLASLGLYAWRRDRMRLTATSAVAIATPALAFSLVPQHGLIGMAWANIGASFIGLAIICLSCRGFASSR